MALKTEKSKARFYCSQCGNEASRWFGRCTSCGAWNTAVEAPVVPAAGRGRAGTRWAPGAAPGARQPRPLAAVETRDMPRARTGIGELDRVLGGGIVAGSLVLVGGDPGIGKSTLLLQLAIALAGAGRKVLVVSGEESERQVRMRASRIGPVPDGVLVLCETDIEAVLEAVRSAAPDVLIVDSIQALSRADLEGGPGSVTQVRECGLMLMHLAKNEGPSVFLVGHVTKDGAVAGPRVLEHMVDAVLYLEGERYQHYRTLRAAKNRFGSTHELGVFEMEERGLIEVENPSAAFLSETRGPEPGSGVVASLEGTRPLLVEVQALVSSSFYGVPQRVTSGLDPKRLAVLLAVLERRVRLRLGRHDVFVTVTGGLRLDEPATDLGVALAVASSFLARPVLERTLLVGEVSLAGELRRVPRIAERVREAAQLGFVRAVVPAAQQAELRGLGVEVVPANDVRESIDRVLGPRVTPPPPETRGGTELERGAERRGRPVPPPGAARSSAESPPAAAPRGGAADEPAGWSR